MRGLSRYFKTGPVFMTGWILHTVRRLRSRQMCSTIVRLHLNRPLRLPLPCRIHSRQMGSLRTSGQSPEKAPKASAKVSFTSNGGA